VGDHRLSRAKELYERATFGGDHEALAAGQEQLDRVEADLALARGRMLHAAYLAERREDPRELELFDRAVTLYRRLADPAGEAEAAFWLGTFHQVVRGDGDAALPALQRSYTLADQVGDGMTKSYAARHLGFHAMAAGRLDEAGERFEESLRLRREAGHRPAVAAALLALAEWAAEAGDRPRAATLLAEAGREAEQSGAAGVLRWIDEARRELDTGA
jgi:hypothetical protein